MDHRSKEEEVGLAEELRAVASRLEPDPEFVARLEHELLTRMQGLQEKRRANSRRRRRLRRVAQVTFTALMLILLAGVAFPHLVSPVGLIADGLQVLSFKWLYGAARISPPRAAVPLYALLARGMPEIEEYFRVWSAEARLPSVNAVADLEEAAGVRPNSPAAYWAHLALARHYAGTRSQQTVDEYKAVLAIDDTAEARLELARYLAEQSVPRAAYHHYLAVLGRRHDEAVAGMLRTGPDAVSVAEDLLGRGYCGDALEILSQETGCPAHCARTWALQCLGLSEALAEEEKACQECSSDPDARIVPAEETTPSAPEELLASDDPVDWWSATWPMEEQGRIRETLPIYLRVAESDVYVSDDAAYRALILARRQGDAEAEARALGILQEMQPNWYAWRATGEMFLRVGPPPADEVSQAFTAEMMRRVVALDNLGREDLAEEELRFIARVTEKPEVILRVAQEFSARGDHHAAYSLAEVFRDIQGKYAPLAYWELAYPRPYAEEVTRWGQEYGVEPELAWAVMREQSRFRPDVLSPAGAKGLMYIMPETFADFHEMCRIDYGPADAFRPEVNIRVGVWHLARMLAYYDGDRELALMAYNAGPGTVDEWLEERTSDNWDEWRFVPFGETREFLSRVSGSCLVYRALYAGDSGQGS